MVILKEWEAHRVLTYQSLNVTWAQHEGHRPSQGGEQLASKLGKAEAAFKWPQETIFFFNTREISTSVGNENLRAENLSLLLDAL